MQHEFFDCLRKNCYVSNTIIPRNPIAIWPQLVKDERRTGYYSWQIYIEWKPERRGHVNAALVCEMHHNALLELVERESALEVKEQEATDRWLIKQKNQMLAP